MMGSRDPRVDAYIAKSAPFAKPILTYIRKAVHAGCPDVEETMKWSFPHFMYKGMLCGMASFKEHCALGFWKGALLEGAGAKAKDAMGQFREDCVGQGSARPAGARQAGEAGGGVERRRGERRAREAREAAAPDAAGSDGGAQEEQEGAGDLRGV